MKTLEIVFGNSCYMSMKKSSLKSNDILYKYKYYYENNEFWLEEEK